MLSLIGGLKMQRKRIRTTNYTLKCRLWRPKFSAKSAERLHHEVALPAYYDLANIELNYSVNISADKVFIIYEIIVIAIPTISVFFVEACLYIAFEIIAVILFSNLNP